MKVSKKQRVSFRNGKISLKLKTSIRLVTIFSKGGFSWKNTLTIAVLFGV